VNQSVSQEVQPSTLLRLGVEADRCSHGEKASTEQEEGKAPFDNTEVNQCYSNLSDKPNEELMEINAYVYICARKI
jgi:hypothetical protein